MEILILAVVIGLIPAAVASSKGRNFVLWWIYGAAIWIVAMPHALLLKKDQRELDRQQLAGGDGKKCVYCAEIIRANASVCRFCNRDQLVPAAR